MGAQRVHRSGVGLSKLAVPRYGRDEPGADVDAADTKVAGVGDIEVAQPVGSDTDGIIERRRGPGNAVEGIRGPGDGGDAVGLRSHAPHQLARRLRDEQITGRIERDGGGLAQISLGGGDAFHTWIQRLRLTRIRRYDSRG